jgi:hypothetical protein
MAITREQLKAANKRGSAAIARGPVARAAGYDARRALIVIALEGGCEFSFPTALAEGLTDAPRSKLKNRDPSERTGIALAAARCRPLRSSAHRRRFRFTSMDATYR